MPRCDGCLKDTGTNRLISQLGPCMPSPSARLKWSAMCASTLYWALLEFRGQCEIDSRWVVWVACESRTAFKCTCSCNHNYFSQVASIYLPTKLAETRVCVTRAGARSPQSSYKKTPLIQLGGYRSPSSGFNARVPQAQCAGRFTARQATSKLCART